MKSRFIILSVSILIFGFLFWRTGKLNEEIKKNHLVICGEITRVYSHKGVSELDYFYEINGVRYSGNCSCSKTIAENFRGKGQKNILVVVEKSDYKNSRTLESPSDFREFNIIPSDTVNLICPELNFLYEAY
jgi:hypothetical protein